MNFWGPSIPYIVIVAMKIDKTCPHLWRSEVSLHPFSYAHTNARVIVVHFGGKLIFGFCGGSLRREVWLISTSRLSERGGRERERERETEKERGEYNNVK